MLLPHRVEVRFIKFAGSRPAIGYSPGNVHQIVGSTMNIPFFTGTQIGGMQMGPGVVGPTMAGPAPAANGPAPATTGNRGGNAAGAAAAAGAAGAAGGAAGAGTGRGGPTGLNLGSLLQSAFGGAGGHPGQPNRPGQTVSALSPDPTVYLHTRNASLRTCVSCSHVT